MPRETVLDDLVEKRIVDALKEGHSYATSARKGGITENTLREWIRRGEGRDDRDDPKGRYATFATKVREADYEAEDEAVAVVRSKFVSGDAAVALRAAQWWLQRRRPTEWGEAKDAEPLTQEEAERLVAEAAQLIAAGGKP